MCKKLTSMNRLVSVTFVVMLLPCFVLGRASAQDEALATTEALLKAAVSHLDMRMGHQRDIDSAIELLEHALALAETPEEYAKIGTLLGRCYIWAHQKPDRAIEVLQKVLEYDPEFEYIFYRYGDELYEARSKQPPEEWFEELPIAPPELPDPPPPGMPPDLWGPVAAAPPRSAVYGIGLAARVTLGDAYYHGKGDKEAGLREWETALESYPDAGVLSFWVSRARQELGLIGALGDSPPMVFVRNTYFTGNVSNANDRLLVSVPELAQRLRVVVTPKSNRQLEISSEKQSLVLSVGSRQAVLDGKRITLPVAPVMVKGKLLVPLRFVAESFGRTVVWEALPRIAWVR